MLYTSIHNDKIKNIKKLSKKKYRELFNKFLVEGEHLVKEAYNSGFLEEIVLLEGTDCELDVNKIYVNNTVLNYISDLDTPQKMIGICRCLNDKIEGKRILIIDGIQDPGNLGTIIRSSVAFNVDSVILSEETVDVYNSKVIRASQGMIFGTNIVVRNIKEILSVLKEKGFKIYGTRVTDGEVISTINDNLLVLIIGNEGNGVSEEILDLCDKYIYINMNEKCESLNVAVATSIILYELDKR